MNIVLGLLVIRMVLLIKSDTHLIKDCDFYEKQITNRTVGITVSPAVRPQPVPTGKSKLKPVPTGKPKVTLVPTGKHKVTPVSTGKPKVKPVPTGQPKVTPVPTGKPQICDKKNQVLFIKTECLVLSTDFKLPDDSMVAFKVPRKHNLYTINLNDLCPRGNLACLVAHASFDESVKWHRQMAHVNYKNMNRVYNVPNKRVEESRNLQFLEEKPNVQGLRHEWYFDLNYLTNFLGYKHVLANQPAGTQRATTNSAGTQDADSNSGCDERVIIVPSYPSHSIQGTQPTDTPSDKVDDSPFPFADENFQTELARLKGEEQRDTSDVDSHALGTANNAEDLQTPPSVNLVPPGCIPVPTGSIPVPTAAAMVPADDILVHSSSLTDSIFDGEPTTRLPCLSDLGNNNPLPGIFSSSPYDDEFDTALNNVASFVEVSPVATKRINTIHPQSLIIRDPTSAVKTRCKVKQHTTGDSAFISYIFDQQRDNHTDFQHCLFDCFLSQVEPRSVAHALEDPSWVDAMQEEMQQFKFRNVWVLVDFPTGPRKEEGIDYDEVFAPFAQIEAIRLFLAFASYMGFLVYQMDVKSAFLYERIIKALYGLHQAPRAWYATLSTFLLKHGYKRGTIDKTLFLKKNNRDIILVQVYVDDIIFGSTKKAWCDEFEALMKGEFQMIQQRPDGIFIHQEKYVQEILNKFDLRSVRTATTPYEAPKPKSHNASDSAVNVHLYRSMIGLWYPKESPLVLEAYSDSDYAGAKKDQKSTTGGFQFLGRRLISWQCKKQTIVATSSTEAEYVAAANCCAQ
nr:hypothetical protein [Tanacetum cinerariifolium]